MRRAGGQAARDRPRGLRWFPITLVALPLAAFTAVFFAPQFNAGPPAAQAATPFVAAPDTETAQFPVCGSGPRITCIVDGDTLWYEGTKIRIADIDTPEVSSPGCAREAQLGARATLRLQALINAGAFTLASNPEGRETDRYGRALRVVKRGGVSVGDTLVAEGLAEEWGGPSIEWCR